jgi:predicted alpha/beta superfamily hydrolase
MIMLGKSCWLVLALVCSSANAAERECMPDHETFKIASSAMQEDRTINVYLPPAYSVDTTAVFPVMYMPDGGEMEDFPHVASAIDRAIAEGAMRPVILVGIENTQRRRDMTGPTQVPSDREIAPRVGGSATFRRFIKTELFEAVDARYRTSASRGIIGESLAGLFVVETFVRDRSMFDTYIAFSPSLWWNEGALLREASTELARNSNGATLYMAAADEENIVPLLRDFRKLIAGRDSANLRWTIEEYPSLSHATIYRALAPSILRNSYPTGDQIKPQP